MFLNSSTSLVPPNNNNDNQYLYPAYSCEHLLVPPCYYSHYKSEPNVTLHFNNQVCISIKFWFISVTKPEGDWGDQSPPESFKYLEGSTG